jgi:hypothetical protein
MAIDLETLLAVRIVRALDVDGDGRVLAGTDERGSMQLIEIDPGAARRLHRPLRAGATPRHRLP